MTTTRKPPQAAAKRSTLPEIFGRREALLAEALAGRGSVNVVETPDIMALRWIYPGGVMPVVFTQAGSAASGAAMRLSVPVFALADGAVDPAAPAEIAARPPTASTPAGLDAWIRSQAEFLATFDLDAGAVSKADWLVISYGAVSTLAALAVMQAREKDLTVAHLALKCLFPLPERKIAALAMGKRFIVVPETGAAQLHGEIQRIVPSLPVVAVSAKGSDDVLATLMKFPRCC